MKPIVKWAGGKSRLLPKLLEHVPEHVKTYVEPFAGGAALFFALRGEAIAKRRRIERAILADQNAELVACYTAVRDDVDSVIEALGEYRYDKKLFYETRDKDSRKMGKVARAARFLFLNRTCFNGLWRVNAAGRFNVPFGRYKKPRIVNADGLRDASRALQGVEIIKGDFMRATKDLRRGDFVYFDPPYVPLSKTAAFTAYAKDGFDDHDQRRLVDEMRRLADVGVGVMLSNHDTKETQALYRGAGFALHDVLVSRPINSDAKKRGNARELIVTAAAPLARVDAAG